MSSYGEGVAVAAKVTNAFLKIYVLRQNMFSLWSCYATVVV